MRMLVWQADDVSRSSNFMLYDVSFFIFMADGHHKLPVDDPI